MKSAWFLLAGLAVAPVATSGFAQQMDFDKVQIVTEQLGPNVYMLTGSSGLDPSHEDAAGGRMGMLAGPDGILLIDSQYAQLTDKSLAAVRKISKGRSAIWSTPTSIATIPPAMPSSPNRAP
jgi:cyclase